MAEVTLQGHFLQTTFGGDGSYVPKKGQLIVELDAKNKKHKLKIGDGTTTYSGLGYIKASNDLTKSDVGLSKVVNTGDSATPVSGGTTKFTTGGAYTELAKKVNVTAYNEHLANYTKHVHAVTLTPAGSVSQPTFTGTEITTGAASATKEINYVTSVGTAASHSYTAPSMTATIANNCMEITFNKGAHSFTANKVPTTTKVTVALAHTHKATAAGTVSKPTFTGTEVTVNTAATA